MTLFHSIVARALLLFARSNLLAMGDCVAKRRLAVTLFHNVVARALLLYARSNLLAMGDCFAKRRLAVTLVHSVIARALLLYARSNPLATGDCFVGKSTLLAMTLAMTQGMNMSDRQYCVYIMTNAHHTVLYTGVTNDLQRRVLEHRDGKTGFTKRYNVNKLVFFETGDDINVAIAREKQIKGGSRKKKLDLINSVNPEWKDLFEEYFAK